MTGTAVSPAGHSYTVEVRFFGDALDPSEISRKLGLEPTRSRARTSVPSNGKARRPFWAYNGESEDGFCREWISLEAGLEFLVRRLMPMRSVVVDLSQEFEGIWWCGHFQSSFDGGPLLSPKILLEIGDLGLPLYIDNYFSDNP